MTSTRAASPAAAAAAAALSLLALFLAAAAPATAQWVVETNSLRILEPSSVAGRHDAAIGDFGVPLYGATLTGEIRHVKVDACKPFPKEAVEALKSSSSSSSSSSSKSSSSSSNLPVIALVDRGDCYFIEKAFNAEKAGAAALIVADDRDEPLVTMAAPDDRPEISKLKEDISIPTALITQRAGKKLKEALADRESSSSSSSSSSKSKVVAELDWTDAVAHPDSRVEWELWSGTPDDGCGASCDRLRAFKKDFEKRAVELEEGGFVQFTPRFATRRCTFGAGDDDRSSKECERNCIHGGRYCAMGSPVSDEFKEKYTGKHVVAEAKRQLCAFRVASRKEDRKPWAWWRFSVQAAEDCSMRRGKFGDEGCLREALDAAGIDHARVDKCVGDVDADEESEIMEENLDAQGLSSSSSSSSRVLITPTVVINGAQYRGRLDAPSVTRGLCAGFSEATEPQACLTPAMEVNECASPSNGGCWKSEEEKDRNGEFFSACVDTFRGFKCQCPFGFRGDGKSGSGSGSSKNGGCVDIDECAEGTAQCDQECRNTFGGYECSCRKGYKQVGGNSGLGACFPADGVDLASALGGVRGKISLVSFIGVAAAAAVVAVLAGVVVHRGRARAEARAEVAAILRQYMPLEGDDDVVGAGSEGGGGGGGGGFPFGRSRTTSTSASSAFFGAFPDAAVAPSSANGGSGNYSSSSLSGPPSEVGLTPTASAAEALEAAAAAAADEKEREEEKSGGGGGGGGASASNV